MRFLQRKCKKRVEIIDNIRVQIDKKEEKMKEFKDLQNKHIWKNKNKRYLFELQKFLDLIDNIVDEKLKKEILYQFTKYDKVITELAEEMIEKA